MDGFKRILDDAEFTLGAIDEPEENQETASVAVEFTNGVVTTVDAIGVGDITGTATIHGFNWSSYNEEVIRELANETGMAYEEATEEIDMGSQVLILEFVAPWESVVTADVDNKGVVE